jgi:metal-responsive CopG/Arc/MetJ family transcriptional regulator
MTTARKVKVSVSLGADLLRTLDRLAASEGSTRSSVMERWLREASRRARLARLEEETASYYDALTPAERDEDARWAAAASRAGRKLQIDDARATTRRRRR